MTDDNNRRSFRGLKGRRKLALASFLLIAGVAGAGALAQAGGGHGPGGRGGEAMMMKRADQLLRSVTPRRPDAERPWSAFPARFLEAVILVEDTPPGEIDHAVARLTQGLGSRIEVFAPSGRRIAAAGAAVDDIRPRGHAIALSDGRVVRAGLAEPARGYDPLLFLATIVAVRRSCR